MISVGHCRELYSERVKKIEIATERKVKRETAKIEKKIQVNAQAEDVEADEESEKKIEKEKEKKEEEEKQFENHFHFFSRIAIFSSMFDAYVIYKDIKDSQKNEKIYEDLIADRAVIEEKRVRKSSRKTLKKDSDSSFSFFSFFSRRRKRHNFSSE